MYVQAIQCVPILDRSKIDKRMWTHSKCSTYTVRSAYRIILQKFTLIIIRWVCMVIGNSFGIWRSPREWKCLCGGYVEIVSQPKLTFGLGGVQCLLSCPLCEREVEIPLHSFLSCTINRGYWEIVQVKEAIEDLTLQADSSKQLVFLLFNQLSNEKRKRVAMLLWSLWRRRNEKLWENACSCFWF